MDFDAMEATESRRYCNKCRKEVFDLTNCSLDEVAALQKKHGTICGSIRVVAVAASLSAAACADKSHVPVSSQGHHYPSSAKSGIYEQASGTIAPLPQNTPESRNNVP